MDLHTKKFNQQNACNTFTRERVITSPTYKHAHLVPFDPPAQLDSKSFLLSELQGPHIRIV